MATKKANKGGARATVSTAALAAVAAAGAGYYFYGTANAKQHRSAASTWAKGLKKEVLKEAKALKKLDAKTIGGIVDKAVTSYKSTRGASPEDLTAAARELKKNWDKVKAELAPSPAVKKTVKKLVKAGKPAAKTVKKVAAKAKKVAKKTAKRI